MASFQQSHLRQIGSLDDFLKDELSKQTEFLQTQATSLEDLQTNQKQQSEAMEKQLMVDIGNLLSNFTRSQQDLSSDTLQPLRSNFKNQEQKVNNVASQCNKQNQKLQNHVTSFHQQAKRIITETNDVSNQQQERCLSDLSISQKQVSDLEEQTNTSTTQLQACFDSHHSKSLSVLTTYTDKIQTCSLEMHQLSNQRQEMVVANHSSTTQQLSSMQQVESSTSEKTRELLKPLENLGNDLVGDFSRQLEEQKIGTQTFVKERLRKDEPTGSTPKKRTYPHPKGWKRARAEQEVLESLPRHPHDQVLLMLANTDDLQPDSLQASPSLLLPKEEKEEEEEETEGQEKEEEEEEKEEEKEEEEEKSEQSATSPCLSPLKSRKVLGDSPMNNKMNISDSQVSKKKVSRIPSLRRSNRSS
eukprot:Lithocolla_globosa_v1_NODE_3001_length_1799_cov_3.820528.p1 type:complete len:415 gc:universal NODE_3001_length_1799_cov_3.820528:1278-34(-)